MNTDNKNTENEALVLADKITISECKHQHALLTEKIKENSSVLVDATEVKQIDTAALQLLAVLMKNDGKKDCKISWSGVSEDLLERSTMLGLNECLGIK